MSNLLHIVNTGSAGHAENPGLTEVSSSHKHSIPIGSGVEKARLSAQVPDDIVSCLKGQPAESEVQAQLQWLLASTHEGTNIRIPSPRSSRILRVILDHTVPDLWESSKKIQVLLIQCLSSLPGISGLVSKILSTAEAVSSRPKAEVATRDGDAQHDRYVVLLERILSQDAFLQDSWRNLSSIDNTSRRRILWKELTTLITSGKIISAVARYQDATNSERSSWVASGYQYSSHLAGWILEMGLSIQNNDLQGWEAATALLSKGFGLGYAKDLIKSLLANIFGQGYKDIRIIARLARDLRPLDQKRFIDHLIVALQSVLPQSNKESLRISQESAVISSVVSDSDALNAQIATWLKDPRTACTVPRTSRRAMVAVATVEQEACAEVILLCAGHVKRLDPQKLKSLARSSIHTNGVSNRLNASSQRSRMLGMCVGMGISRLVDEGSMIMNFDVDDVKSQYAQHLMELVDTRDTTGSLNELTPSKNQVSESAQIKTNSSKTASTKTVRNISATPALSLGTGPRIVEVLSDDEDGDLVPYAKPDSDPEDDDEDPTLVNRNKSKAPVYIKDLMSGLRDDENYDRHKLSLENAAPLIRRKAKFGKEVSDHALELSLTLIGLQDTFETDNFIELRLQALIALLLSDPSELGPVYARHVFEGDYSLSQRGTLLSAIGLGARELAGYKDEDALNPQIGNANSFASKRLPDKYHSIYAAPRSTTKTLPSTPLNAISASLTDFIMAPLAAQAADSATGPTALKVRTFSSRLSSKANRTKAIPNALAATLADSFFTPLAGFFYTHTRTSSSHYVFSAPFFLSTYLITLAVLLHASGPSTRSLAQLTTDFWALLLSARRAASDDTAVLRALLFGFLTLLEVNQDDTRAVAADHGRELVETREWVSDVYGRLAGGDEESDRLRGLAAGVLVKCGEVMEKWQRLLVGDMMDY
ncbi:hypothetical protein ANO11243_040160 [Dothideomycetidae sp. 11243]|nr:hypothetical protein ANO11243_040160 [fungal sp. No.11243]